ncbi:MAG: DUF4270 domain-containing protein [Prevotellaceae bacterium]|jgi:hypothetical protein|nr:DUF4270 domain-containing protein [Prevotellaceae bacterium]
MKKYYKNMIEKFTKKAEILFFFILILLFASCTNVDKTIGIDFIPDDEQITLVTDTLYPSVYNITLDSVMTKNLQYNSFGSYYDPMFGTTTAGMAFQIAPTTDSVSFGTTHTVDSVVLQMIVTDRTGDNSYNQTLKVYELNKKIYYDSIYYPTVDINSMIAPVPVGTKDYQRTPKDRWDIADTIKIRLDNSIGEKLTSAPMDVMTYDSIDLFYEYFKGLYITSDDVASGITGRMNRIPLSTTSISLSVYYKRDGQDTTANYWHYNAGYMESFTAVQHDYTTATHSLKINTASLNDTSSTAALDSTLYIQGLFGITPMIKIRKDDIQNWLTAKNLNIEQIAISRVMLEFDVERFAGYEPDKTVTPIGLFYRSRQKTSDTATVSYPHLLSINELNSSLFGGALNRTLHKYSMKVTYDFISIIKNIETSNSVIIYVSPYLQLTNTSYYGSTTYSYIENQALLYQTLLKGSSSSQPPRLIITYAKPKYQ